MATALIMPKQGQSVETCTIVGWKKNVGDTVKLGEIICEVETDKATFEVESPAEGTVLAIFHQAGAQVPVLAPIAAIGKPGEDVEAIRRQAAEEAGEAAGAAPPRPAAPGAAASPAPAAGPLPAVAPLPLAAAPASPRARALASSRGVELSGLAGTGPGGRIIERDVLAALEGREPLSPAAREKAAGLAGAGAAIPAAGSGIGGRVMAADVTAAPAAGPLPLAAAPWASFSRQPCIAGSTEHN